MLCNSNTLYVLPAVNAIDAIRLTTPTPMPYIANDETPEIFLLFWFSIHESLNQGLGHFLSSKLNFLIHLLWYLLSKNV